MDLELSPTYDSEGNYISDDILLDGNDFTMIVGIEEIGQRIKTNLKLYFDEWFLASEEGIDYFGQIYNDEVDDVVRSDIFKNAILSTEGVNSLKEFSTVLIDKERTYKVTAVVSTGSGDITINEVIP